MAVKMTQGGTSSDGPAWGGALVRFLRRAPDRTVCRPLSERLAEAISDRHTSEIRLGQIRLRTTATRQHGAPYPGRIVAMLCSRGGVLPICMLELGTQRPRIYADFNGLVAGVRDPARTAVVLDTFGTARDLANAGIVLHDGCELITYDWSDDDEDLEGHGTAYYDPVRRWWIVEFDEQGVRYVPKRDRSPVTVFRCVCCRQDLSSWLASKRGRSADDLCPSCSTPIFAAITPPAPRE